jgi:hypothetical protein
VRSLVDSRSSGVRMPSLRPIWWSSMISE